MDERVARVLIGTISLAIVAVVGLLMLVPPPSEEAAAVSALPRLNAILNGTSAVALGAGWLCIRRRWIVAHQACMLTAFALSTLFLASYVLYHAQAGSRPFAGEGWIRPVYFALLISHIVLATVILPLVLTTIYRAWRGDFARHARIARWTLPLWLYVSVTGVLVYSLLYHLPP
jgi:putative membrane protein